MKICSSINEILRKKDKINKTNLSFQINADNNYKDKYIRKMIFKKKVENNISSERKKSLKKKDNLTKRNTVNYNYMSNKNNHKFNLKRSQSVADFSKWDKLNRPLGPYYNIQNKLFISFSKKSNNNSTNYNLDINKYNKYKNNKGNLNLFILNKNKYKEKNKRLINDNNIHPYNSQYSKKNNYLESQKNIYKNNIKNKNKRISRTYINTKININDVNKNLNFFKLSKNIKNDNLVNLKQYININNKNRKSHSFFDEKNKICENVHFSFQNIFKKNKDIKNKILLLRQSNENFSMNNIKIKAFDKLYPNGNIILNFSSNENQKNINKKSLSTNYKVCSNQAEYNIIKEPKLKNDLKENDTNKNFIININQISNISPKIKYFQNDYFNEKLNEINNNEINQKIITNNRLKKEKISDNNNINDKNYELIDGNKNNEENKLKEKIKIIESKKDLKKINDNIQSINNNKKEKNNNNENKIQKRIKEINDNIEKQNQKEIKEESNISKEKKNEIDKNKIENNNIIMNYNNNDIENKIKEENNKNSKQFNRFKAGLRKKIENNIKKDGDKYHISAKIIKKASKLEEQIGNQNLEKEEENIQKSNNIELENENNVLNLIKQKPVSYKKKKTSKINFSDE